MTKKGKRISKIFFLLGMFTCVGACTLSLSSCKNKKNKKTEETQEVNYDKDVDL